MSPVYSRDGSPAFNERLHETMVRIADEVEKALGDNLVALVLGGGYGRGEGGIILVGGDEMPYNDLDFTLIVARKFSVPWDSLNAIRASFGKELNIHVDFSRPLTIQDVENWPCWLMWYDLVNGHVVLKGSPNVLTSQAPSDLKKPLPAIEGTRLLLNRGAGLLEALRIIRGIEDQPDEDFVRRNYYKCALAVGDALLIAYQRYTTKYMGRDKLLEDLERDEPQLGAFRLQDLYKEALRFKFRPDQVSSSPITEENLRALAEVWGCVFLHVEMVRTRLVWSRLDEYVQWNGIREKDQHAPSRIFRNVTRNLQMRRWSWRYPREELYRQLPVLLGLADVQVVDWPQDSAGFLRVWYRFN